MLGYGQNWKRLKVLASLASLTLLSAVTFAHEETPAGWKIPNGASPVAKRLINLFNSRGGCPSVPFSTEFVQSGTLGYNSPITFTYNSIFPENIASASFRWEFSDGLNVTSASPATTGNAVANQVYAKSATVVISEPGNYTISGEVKMAGEGAKYASKRTFYIRATSSGVEVKDSPFTEPVENGEAPRKQTASDIVAPLDAFNGATRTTPPAPEIEISHGNSSLNATTTISGFFRYRNEAGTLSGAYGTLVEAWDRNPFGDSRRGVAVCNTDGSFSVSFDNAESGGIFDSGTADIYLVFRTENGAVKVQDYGSSSYSTSTGTGNAWYYANIPGGAVNAGSWYADWGTNGTSDNSERAWQLCDYMSTVWAFCFNQGYEAHFTTLEWRLNKNDVWPHYEPSNDLIQVPDNNYSSYFVIYHEYGHSHMDSIYGEQMIPNSTGSHSIEGHYTTGLAMSEGYASYVGQGTSNQSRYLDFNPANYIDWDAEPNRDGYGSANSNTDNLGYGYDSEGPVQSFLLDLWDAEGAPTDPYDRIDVTHGRIMDIMKNYQPGGHDVYSIQEFIDGWENRGYDQKPKMWGEAMVHGMVQNRLSRPTVGMEYNGAYSGVWYWDGYASGWMNLRNYGSQTYNSWTSGQWVWIRFGGTDHTGYSQLGDTGTSAGLAADDTRYLYLNTEHLFPNSRYIGQYNVGFGAYFSDGWRWFYPAGAGYDQFIYRNVVADTTPPSSVTVTDDGATQGRNDRLHFSASAVENDSGILGFWYAVGTGTTGAAITNTVGWTWVPNQNVTTIDRTITGLNLSYGTTYYVTVVARNVENQDTYGYSNGILISDPTAPVNVSVTDDGLTTTNASQLHFNIHGEEPDGRIGGFWHRILDSNNVEVAPWVYLPALDTTDVSITRTGLSLVNGQTYYIQVTCRNLQGVDGWAISNGIQVAQGRTVSGRINAPGFNLSGRTAIVWVCASLGSYDEAHYVTLDAAGNYSFQSAQFGSKRIVATLYLPTRHWLWQAKNATISAATGGIVPQFTLVNGDCDFDNEITILDYIILSAAYGTTSSMSGWDARADLDEDGEVTILDYLILSGNYEAVGDF